MLFTLRPLVVFRYDESYSWQMVNCCVHNIIVGTLWIEHVSYCILAHHGGRILVVT